MSEQSEQKSYESLLKNSRRNGIWRIVAAAVVSSAISLGGWIFTDRVWLAGSQATQDQQIKSIDERLKNIEAEVHRNSERISKIEGELELSDRKRRN